MKAVAVGFPEQGGEEGGREEEDFRQTGDDPRRVRTRAPGVSRHSGGGLGAANGRGGGVPRNTDDPSLFPPSRPQFSFPCLSPFLAPDARECPTWGSRPTAPLPP